MRPVIAWLGFWLFNHFEIGHCSKRFRAVVVALVKQGHVPLEVGRSRIVEDIEVALIAVGVPRVEADVGHVSGHAVKVIGIPKGGRHFFNIKAHGHGQVLDDAAPRLGTVGGSEEGHVHGLAELACWFNVVPFQARHEVFVTVDRQTTDDRQTNIRVDGVDEVPVGVGMDVVNDDQVCGLACFQGADFVVPVGGERSTGCDHFHHFVIGEDVPQHFVVPKVGDFEFVQGGFGTRRSPIWCQRDVNPSSLCCSNIGRLTVEEEVGQRRPHEGSSDVGHLGEFLLTECHAVNEDQFAHEQVVLHEDVKLRAALFVHTLSDVNEPSVQLAAGVSCLDVVADIIGGQFGDFGVDFVPAEVIILDVP